VDDSRGEDVGSVAEEAGKLFGALRDWARDSGIDAPTTTAYQEAAASAAAGATTWLHEVGEHRTTDGVTGAEECRWCPVCRAVAVFRGTSPEVRAHLVAAATSLVQAASGLLDTPVPDRTGRDAAGTGTIDPEDAGSPADDHGRDPDDPGAATWEDD